MTKSYHPGPSTSRTSRNGTLCDDAESARWACRTARTRESPPDEVLRRLAPDWAEAVLLGQEDGEPGLNEWLKQLCVRLRTEPDRYEAITQALDAAWAEGPTDPPSEADKPTRPPPFRLNPLGAIALNRAVYRTRWYVERILVAGQPGVVGAPKKSMKTSTMVDLAVSLASGLPFLGRFSVPERVPVLLLSGESGDHTIQETVRRVCRSKGIDVESLEGFLFVEYQLPQLGVEEHLAELARVIREHKIQVVIIDPLYLCLLGGTPGRRLDAGNLFDMGPLLLSIGRTCLDAGATPLLVHHFKKGGADPYELPELEELAYSGIQEYARQWILLKRRERYEPGSGEHRLWLCVGGSAGHSGEWALDVSEGSMDLDFRGREWNVTIRPASEARAATAEQRITIRAAKEAEREQVKATAKQEQERKDVGITTAVFLKQPDRRLTLGMLREATGWRYDKARRALFVMHQEGRIRPVQFKVVTGNGTEQTCAGFELVDDGRMDA